MYNWYRNIFHAFAVLIVFMQRTKKLEENKAAKQRKENQNVFVVTNPPGSSLLCCRTAIAPMSHQYHYAVALLSLRCRTAIAPVFLHCRSTAVATQSHHYHTAIAPLLLRYCCSFCRYAVAPAITSAVAPLLGRFRTAVAPLSLLLIHCRCCRSCCCNGITAAIAEWVLL